MKCTCFGESLNSAHNFSEEETGTNGLNPVLVLILSRVEKVVLALWPKQTLSQSLVATATDLKACRHSRAPMVEN